MPVLNRNGTCLGAAGLALGFEARILLVDPDRRIMLASDETRGSLGRERRRLETLARTDTGTPEAPGGGHPLGDGVIPCSG